MRSGANKKGLFQENTFENVVCETVAILFRPQCVSYFWTPVTLFFTVWQVTLIISWIYGYTEVNYLLSTRLYHQKHHIIIWNAVHCFSSVHYNEKKYQYTDAKTKWLPVCGRRLTRWRHQMETFSALLALCAGNSPVPVISQHKGQRRGALMLSLI